MSEPRIVKRYANRKLYDTQRSHYVTLDQIAEMIRAGEEVQVLDNNSKEDLTSVTLAQIIFEEEKRQKSFLPLGAMRNIIQSGGASLTELAQQAQARVLSVFRKSEGEDQDAAESAKGAAEAHSRAPGPDEKIAENETAKPAGPQKTRTPEEADVRREEATSHNAVRELIERSQQTIEEWQRRVDDRIRHIIETLSPFATLEKEVARLNERLDAVEKKLEANKTAPISDETEKPK